MKTTNRFDRAISALVNGYFGNTLTKGSSCGCAVGNMIAQANGFQIVSKGHFLAWKYHDNFTPSNWGSVFSTHDNGCQVIQRQNYYGLAKSEIDSTGYSLNELIKVERVFESTTKIHFEDYYDHTPEEIDADQYAGLMAVVDTLCQIEGISDPADYKALFAGKTLQPI